MKSARLWVVLVGALLAGAALAAPEVEGFWQGAIDVGSSKIEVEVEFRSAGEEGLSGEISFPSQGDYGLGLEILEADGPAIRFTILNVPGEPVFDGRLGEEGERLSGRFSQSGRDYPFELERGEAPTPNAAVGAEALAGLVEAIAERLIEGYVDEDAGKRIAEGLRAAVSDGKLDAQAPAPTVARDLTEQLGTSSNDIHLRVQYRGASSRPEPRAEAEHQDEASHGPGSSGIGGYEIFDRNIGYLNMVHFGGGDAAAAELDKVMAELEGVRGLIIDLRENLGGGPFMVRYLSTYLFAEPTHLASRVGRGMTEPEERWTFKTTRGERLAEVPVVLLISGTTVSAGESFAFGLRNNDRVTIMGERTAGGGHFGEMVDLGNGFSMFLPVGRTINPKTGEGWEAEGLAPDVEMRAGYALEAALERLNSEP